MPPSTTEKDPPTGNAQLSWSVALVAFLLNLAVLIGTISHYSGQKDEEINGLKRDVADLQADRARRLLREQQELYDYQKERAEEIKKIRDLARDLNKPNAPTP